MNKPLPSEKSSPKWDRNNPSLGPVMKLGESLYVGDIIEENKKRYAEIKKARPPGSVTVEKLPDM